jgi:(p)ppGpp synthase/HD superfamily hydrolase
MELFTNWHTWEQAEPGLTGHLPPETVRSLRRAVEFATAWHGDQRRPTGAPYLEHLLEAVEVLVRGAAVATPSVLVAAVLHDVLEDTPCAPDAITEEFSPAVTDLVKWVTIPAAAPGQGKDDVKEAYLRAIRHAPADAILVKLADRASNVQTLRNLPDARARAYYAQTVRFIIPLASGEPWFARWYAQWQAEFADLAA